MPRISILLPVRNAERWLGRTLTSLARQRFRDFEVIAVDDGSTDRSASRLERAAAAGVLRMRVIHTPPLGLPAALNTALAHASAPIVARQDADDLSHRDRLAAQLEALDAGADRDVVGCRVVLFPARAVTDGMRRWQEWHNALLTHEDIHRERFVDSPLAHGGALIRRAWLERVGGWRERGWAEDLDLWLRLFAAGARFAKLPRALYAWRQHPGSATRTDPRYARARFVALKAEFLVRELPAGIRHVDLVAVGRTLATWREALAAHGIVARPRPHGRPTAATIAALARPVVLAYGVRLARERWRRALTDSGMMEGRDFTFVA